MTKNEPLIASPMMWKWIRTSDDAVVTCFIRAAEITAMLKKHAGISIFPGSNIRFQRRQKNSDAFLIEIGSSQTAILYVKRIGPGISRLCCPKAPVILPAIIQDLDKRLWRKKPTEPLHLFSVPSRPYNFIVETIIKFLDSFNDIRDVTDLERLLGPGSGNIQITSVHVNALHWLVQNGIRIIRKEPNVWEIKLTSRRSSGGIMLTRGHVFEVIGFALTNAAIMYDVYLDISVLLNLVWNRYVNWPPKNADQRRSPQD